MARQIQAQPDKKTISDLIGKIQRNELILQPEFQRGFVWTQEHMENFIRTILEGYPFPEIYISQKGIDLETLSTQNVVVDGQQRLTTIKKYIEGTHNFEKRIPKFADLSGEDKTDFLNYDVTVRDLKDVNPEIMIEIFQRINSTKFTLTAIEINNAIYDGQFIKCAKEVLEIFKNVKFKVPIFSESELTRMADLHFLLLIMATIEEGGYFPADNEVEKYIAQYNDEYPRFEEMSNLLSRTILSINESDLTTDSFWYRKSNYFTLVCELLWSRKLISEIIDQLNIFEANVLANKASDRNTNVFAIYYANMYAGTNSRNARVKRSEILKEYVNITNSR
ncbi:DUF262 domain-containing protein [Flavobacterium sp.]|jgi:hypothetical protein|uniref:DUF262 domain-containing protein n=1 Tax=Flavobacterium sp. TaxID=239 RepID=UPI0022BC7041|nr:DUF262 domain-containing protein [Flavobacterium sp.]MCZ8229272.1 DUF262 domain-containing protein [Flavobacterium sp.]